jgi:hypothetical protein
VATGQRALGEILRDNAAAAPSLPGRARRAQHAKHHGCVAATFSVRDDIPQDLRRGLFAQVASYPAVVRFSNGRQPDDRRGDAHGMAIKLLGVPGRKLLEGEETQTAQDFVLVDSEVFFNGRLDIYEAINRGLLQPGRGVFAKLRFGLWLVLRLPLLFRILRFASRRPTSPLTQSYFSTTPYALGDKAVKWVAQPASTRHARSLVTPNGLAEALRRDLSKEAFIFDFGVDVQTDPRTQPIEDPTVPWTAAPKQRRVWLARVEIASQPVDPQARLAEDIAFSPWHGLIEHEPLGLINQVRKPVYRKLAIRRHELNGVQPIDTSELPAGRLEAEAT